MKLLNDPAMTFWEKINTSKWGRYISDVEKNTIFKAIDLNVNNKNVLEIGCDGGRWMQLLSDMGWNLICTDIDKASLDICKRRIPAAKCILVSPENTNLPIQSSSVNLILCIEVFPVIESNWFLSEVYRILDNEGLVVGVFLNKISVRGFFVGIYERFMSKYEYKHYQLSYYSFRKNLMCSGLNILYELGFCWFPFRRSSNSRFISSFIRLESLFRLDKIPTISPWVIFIAKKTGN